jgi:hypothetical protein
MRDVKCDSQEDGLYPWGVAELTDKWVLLHSQGLPKWAIFYKGEGRTVVIPCQALKSQKQTIRKKRRAKIQRPNA